MKALAVALGVFVAATLYAGQEAKAADPIDPAYVQNVQYYGGYSPSYGYGYPNYSYRYNYGYNYNYPSYGYRSYPSYRYSYPSYGYRYSNPRYGYGYGYPYGYGRRGFSFGLRF